MKRLVRILVLVMVFSMTKISVLASEAEISFTVDGRVANENMVTLNLILNDVKDLYAGSFFISFDEKKVQVMEVEAGDLLENTSMQEVKRMVDTQNNSIDYAFTCLANANGIQGEGTLLKIKLKLKSNELSNKIFSDTLIKLVKQTSEKLDYFNVIIDKNLKQSSSSNSSTIKPGQNHSQSNPGNNSNETTGNNPSSSNSNETTGNNNSSSNGNETTGNNNSNSNGNIATGNSNANSNSNVATGNNNANSNSNVTAGSNNASSNNNATTGNSNANSNSNVATGNNNANSNSNVTAGSNNASSNNNATTGNNNANSNSNETTENSDSSEENSSKVEPDNNDSDFSLTENTEQVVTSDESTVSDEMIDGSTITGKDNLTENNKTEGASSKEDGTLLPLNLVNGTVTVSVVVFIIILGIYIKKRFL